MAESIIQQKSFQFALEVINLYMKLQISENMCFLNSY